MSTQAVNAPIAARGAGGGGLLSRIRSAEPGYQAYTMLRVTFTVAPLVAGIDKFFDKLVEWPKYLAGWITDLLPGNADQIMKGVGVVEIVAAIVVALKPRYGAFLVAGWLAGIVIDLLTKSGYYDIALRDFGLMLGALTLGRLAVHYDKPLFGRF